ncbi:phosphoenolpyruvate--protein phosphotransferase [Marinobacter sp. chi1]|uniref:Phosphoenolpyruvate-protein phosphotransferase n=1 Tax=Marinobacter suaedae TaxID=3057675 RepID=A0ABT8VXM4_9GAMM|nr:phosphoenolpyruvate--protein phosphotransferase [Marinobacter sp. chi1]MDO3720747.1 phosphoenolpyruvate--protein phosphotransferase [Marinobacter sp. chi1]
MFETHPDSERGSETEILKGKTISPGMAQGIVHVHHSFLDLRDIPPEAISLNDVEKEFSRLNAATTRVSDDLAALVLRVAEQVDSSLAEVFGAHQLILNDPALREELRREITENLVDASTAVRHVFRRWEKRFLLMESRIARDKSDDLRDVSVRLYNALAGITANPLEEIPSGCVLATSRLLPSDTIFLADRSVAAVLLEYGSFGSHVALFAREMALPCISRLSELSDIHREGALALVDGSAGIVTLRPTGRQIDQFQKKVRTLAKSLRRAQAHALEPAITRDGVSIAVLANVGFSQDTENAMRNGAEGVGLYRLEQAYLGRLEPPSAEALLADMRHTLAAAKGCSVVVRLLDVGADKPLPFIEFTSESNPALGCRGVRILKEYLELLKTQLRAILALSQEYDVRLLIPMVTLAEDVMVVKKHLLALCGELNITTPPQLGAMIETPAAALSARQFAGDVDFLSFGTNDLTQYAFAADRENAAVEPYFNDADAVIFRLMQLTHDDVPEMPLSLCGELAGRPEQVARVLQCGIRTLSVAGPLIPAVKEAIRHSNCLVSAVTKPQRS